MSSTTVQTSNSMSELEEGDYVHVAFDGKVVRAERNSLDLICVRGSNNKAYHWVRPEECTKIKPPVREGDEIKTPEEADELPAGTTVIDHYRMVGRRINNKWFLTGLATGRSSSTFIYPLRVLDIPKEGGTQD